MAVFSYLATFLVRYTQLPTAYITPVLALYGVADIVGNLILSRRIPSQLEGMFKRLLIVLAISLTAISLLGASVWMITFVIAVVGSCHAAAGLMTGLMYYAGRGPTLNSWALSMSVRSMSESCRALSPEDCSSTILDWHS
jgi:DHA1 family inner membrane transport protein